MSGHIFKESFFRRNPKWKQKGQEGAKRAKKGPLGACFIFQVTVQNQTQPRGARGRRWDADALNLSFNSLFPRVLRAPRGSSVQPWLAITVIYFLHFMKFAKNRADIRVKIFPAGQQFPFSFSPVIGERRCSPLMNSTSGRSEAPSS